eukprot:TRINITY_DN8847_c0_g1_i3.p1 TRINITY_DN8847_c0_g1~~TRINITY_DN8847_c0_g1_i3.p1  ORF type:complete len:693 (+),score=143.71 TRINITY_DN8847_c0_g1_i3:34-2079(+)
MDASNVVVLQKDLLPPGMEAKGIFKDRNLVDALAITNMTLIFEFCQKSKRFPTLSIEMIRHSNMKFLTHLRKQSTLPAKVIFSCHHFSHGLRNKDENKADNETKDLHRCPSISYGTKQPNNNLSTTSYRRGNSRQFTTNNLLSPNTGSRSTSTSNLTSPSNSFGVVNSSQVMDKQRITSTTATSTNIPIIHIKRTKDTEQQWPRNRRRTISSTTLERRQSASFISPEARIKQRRHSAQTKLDFSLFKDIREELKHSKLKKKLNGKNKSKEQSVLNMRLKSAWTNNLSGDSRRNTSDSSPHSSLPQSSFITFDESDSSNPISPSSSEDQQKQHSSSKLRRGSAVENDPVGKNLIDAVDFNMNMNQGQSNSSDTDAFSPFNQSGNQFVPLGNTCSPLESDSNCRTPSSSDGNSNTSRNISSLMGGLSGSDSDALSGTFFSEGSAKCDMNKSFASRSKVSSSTTRRAPIAFQTLAQKHGSMGKANTPKYSRYSSHLSINSPSTPTPHRFNRHRRTSSNGRPTVRRRSSLVGSITSLIRRNSTSKIVPKSEEGNTDTPALDRAEKAARKMEKLTRQVMLQEYDINMWFASGQAYMGDFLNSLLGMLYRQPLLLNAIKLLIDHTNDSIDRMEVFHCRIPPRLYNASYEEVFLYFVMKHRRIPLGLYRNFLKSENEVRRFFFISFCH